MHDADLIATIFTLGDTPDTEKQQPIKVTFSNIPRTPLGFIFGAHFNGDVVVNGPGISRNHLSLTFDEKRRPVIKDWGSLSGTQVTFDDDGEGIRHDFQWVVGGHDFSQNTKEIIIQMGARPLFRIQVEKHDITSNDYITKVDQFVKGTASVEELLESFDLPREVTEAVAEDTTAIARALFPDIATPAKAPTQVKDPICIKRSLGQGSYGVVTRHYNVSNAVEFALKEPREQDLGDRYFDASAWKKEANIMEKLSHPHIVKLQHFESQPHPRLQLEYMPKGNLNRLHKISTAETESILSQCLSALTYLHGQEPPIVHRDIKAANILVQRRDSDGIHVKFADFGVSRLGHDMSTFCGTCRYMAPEMYPTRSNKRTRKRMSYSPLVDVWSLGVVVYELLRPPLPSFTGSYRSNGVEWCRAIIKTLQTDMEQRPDSFRKLLQDAMLVLLPAKRLSAQDCYHRAKHLLTATAAGCQTPRPASRTSREHRISTDSHGDVMPEASVSQSSTESRKRRRSRESSPLERQSKRRSERISGRNSSVQQPESTRFLYEPTFCAGESVGEENGCEGQGSAHARGTA
ncbi:hypothetical protein CDD80_3513 [Ophiocordyceps camponoti-rufipedis]|uniref:non-specific serine/threonine protein kinase n=1 Tax=Ophiocordyceps camponoti-rufipedis TaxID=2004952 RepID=A0A2C5Z224_9HYPO|nr:hypothetical protein CDD80_3513 [Ophiocordyceps camponoti-rufipedis]